METLDVDGLIETVKDGNRACVDRGETIDKLYKGGKKLVEIAQLAKLSEAEISHLRTCFLHLQGKAREMCKAGMDAYACYLVANASDLYQKRVLRRAIQHGKERDKQSSLNKGPNKGKQSRRGKITRGDMEAAIQAERYGGSNSG